MSLHIGAKPEQIASTVLLPGDPRRAKFIAETMLTDAILFNEIRGMLGYTGRYKTKRVSVMGTGIGIPSLAIYVNELVSEYQVKTLIRVGTCGALQPHMKVGDIILAMTASTDSGTNRLWFEGADFAPAASFDLLLRAHEIALGRGVEVSVGGVFSGDSFYNKAEWWKKWAVHGVLACEMETGGLYTLAARLKADALSILTVSDSLVTGESSTPRQRERDFSLMAEIALEIST